MTEPTTRPKSRTVRIIVAEVIGTMILIIGGPGTAIFAGQTVGVLGVAFAFGLSLLCAAYLFGHISGCHINPAVTIAMWALKRTPSRELPAYFIGQIVGALLGGVVIWVIVEAGDNTGGKQLTKLARDAAFSGASNGYGSHSPNGFALGAVIITEVVLTALFVLVIVGTTRTSMIPGFAAIPIGLMLTLVHLISIPIDNTSVNPVRSLSTAVFANSWALEQLWVFIVFPILGGLIAAGIWMIVTTPEDG